MKLIKQFVLLLIAVCLMGCTRTTAYIRTDATMDRQFSMKESISVGLPDHPSAIEQNMAKVLSEELKANGFNYTESESDIKMIVSVDRQTTNYGFVSTGNKWGVTTTNRVDVNEIFTYLTAYSTNDPNRGSIWNGMVKTRSDFFLYFPNSLIKLLLAQYGKNSDWWENIDYTYKVKNP
jgi:hypothetical protein